jgi:Tfp pilus assembly protein PilF
MVSCKFCDSTNSIDSAFCKRCGRVIPEDDIKASRVKLEIQIAEGFSLLSEGQISEALATADSVLSDDPSAARGWSLRGHALERKGDLRGAYSAYHNALRYDPDSASDKIKVSQLQGAGGRSMLDLQPSRDRRIAVAAGLATCFLAIAIGAVAATRSAPTPAKTAANLPLESQTGDANYTYFPQTTNRQRPDSKGNDSSSQGGAGQSVGNAERPQSPAQVLPPPSNTLPQPAGDSISGNLEVRPLDPSGAIGSNTKPPVAEEKPGGEAPEIEVSVGQDEPKDPVDTKGYISINLSGNNGVAPANTQLDANGIEALVRTARSQYQVGNYEAAASTYERALASGADPTQINQRLAQCYEKLGRQSDAVQAYQRSIQALEKAIASGKGDKDRLATALDSSKQALKVLQGG